MKQPTNTNKHYVYNRHKLGVCWQATSKKRTTTNNELDEITRNLNRVSITSNSSHTAQNADDILKEWKQHIKENDVFYFLSLTNQVAKGKLLSHIGPTPQLDSEFYYLLGKYASPPIYNLLKNSEFFDIFGTHIHLQVLEGIAAGDNHHMFDHLVEMNEFRRMTYSDVHQYALSLLEHKAYKTMESLIYTVTKRGDHQLKQEFVTKIKANMSRLIEQYDSRMITIIIKGFKSMVI